MSPSSRRSLCTASDLTKKQLAVWVANSVCEFFVKNDLNPIGVSDEVDVTGSSYELKHALVSGCIHPGKTIEECLT